MIAAPIANPLSTKSLTPWAKRILVVFALCLVTGALYAHGMVVHLPTLDESAYLHRGALLIEQGRLHPLADNPAPTLVNGALYSLFHQDGIQLEKVSTGRRWLTLLFLVAGTFYAAANCGMRTRYAAIAALVVGTSPTLRFTVNNSSDALYAIFLIYSFGWAVGEVRRIKDQGSRIKDQGSRIKDQTYARYLLFGLLLCGAALSRNDGLVMGVSALLFFGMVLKQNGFHPAPRIFTAGTAFVAPIVLWIVLTGLQTGDYSTHIPERSYNAFCQGQNILFAGQFIDSPNVPAAESIFGTGSENNNSVARAIARHPRAFMKRLRRIPGNLKDSLITAYGGKATWAVLTVFLMLGLAILAYTSKRVFLLMGGVWLLPLAVYPLSFFRPGYFAMNFPVLCVSSICGIAYWLSGNRFALRQKALFALLACVLLLNSIQVWRGERLQVAGQAGQEMASRLWVSELHQAVPMNTPVIAVDPSLLWYAHLEHREVPTSFIYSCTPSEFTQYLNQHHLKYVVIDPDMRRMYPRLAQVIAASGLKPIVQDSGYGATLYQSSNKEVFHNTEEREQRI